MNHSLPANILITGGTDGIGLRLARLYSAEGCNVVVTGRRDENEVGVIIGDEIKYIRADQSLPEKAATAIVDGLASLGWQHCDVAILNAGCGKIGNPLEETGEHLRLMIDVNLAASILVAHTLAPLLLAPEPENGKLIIIGSTSYRGAKNFASYAAVKAGLHGFARSLREEWRGRIDVKIIHPGPTATDMHAKAGFDPGWMRKLFLRPDAMARLIKRQVEKPHSPVSIGLLAKARDALSSPKLAPKGSTE